MSFSKRSFGPYEVFQYDPFCNEGLVHGFIGASGDFSNKNLSSEIKIFCDIFNVTSLYLPQQVHGVTVLDIEQAIPKEDLQADVLIVAGDRKDATAFGIRTADCVPILIKTEKEIALIHAGWRGLAQGIIEESLQRITPSSTTTALIGPCAGPKRYEVGDEVINSFKSAPVYERDGRGKCFLHLGETAKRILSDNGVTPAQIYALPICTISDETFYSHRRQGLARGSNLMFVAFPHRV